MAIKIESENPLCYFNRALALEAKGYFKDSLGDLNECIKLSEEHHYQYYLTRGLIYKRLNKPIKAINDLTMCLKLKEDHTTVYNFDN